MAIGGMCKCIRHCCERDGDVRALHHVNGNTYLDELPFITVCALPQPSRTGDIWTILL